MATLGEALRAAREQSGLTVEEAATMTRVPRQHLAALEADDVTALPGVPFARGFIRIYAGVLNVPSEPLLTAYSQQLGQAHYAIQHPHSTARKRRLVAPLGLGFSVLALIVIVLMAVLNRPGLLDTTELWSIGGAPETDVRSFPPGSVIEITAIRTTELVVNVDDQPVFEGQLALGGRQRWRPQTKIRIRAVDAAAVVVAINDQPAGRLGPERVEAEGIWHVVTPTGSR